MPQNLLLTGNPGVGKTTLVRKILSRLEPLEVGGFFTEEVRRGKVRRGFKAIRLDGKSSVFADVDYPASTGTQVGKYIVRPEILEDLVLPLLDPEKQNLDLMIIDEIAKMELLSSRIREKILAWLESETPVLGTIAFKGAGLIKKIKQRGDVTLLKVTQNNRNQLEQEILRQLSRSMERPLL